MGFPEAVPQSAEVADVLVRNPIARARDELAPGPDVFQRALHQLPWQSPRYAGPAPAAAMFVRVLHLRRLPPPNDRPATPRDMQAQSRWRLVLAPDPLPLVRRERRRV